MLDTHSLKCVMVNLSDFGGPRTKPLGACSVNSLGPRGLCGEFDRKRAPDLRVHARNWNPNLAIQGRMLQGEMHILLLYVQDFQHTMGCSNEVDMSLKALVFALLGIPGAVQERASAFTS